MDSFRHRCLGTQSFCSVCIYYRGLVRLPTGLAMVGYSSHDVNEVRGRIRMALGQHPATATRFSEPYHHNIVHSTVFRLVHPCPCDDARTDAWLTDVATRFKHSYMGHVTVRTAQTRMGYASWTMRSRDLTDVLE